MVHHMAYFQKCQIKYFYFDKFCLKYCLDKECAGHFVFKDSVCIELGQYRTITTFPFLNNYLNNST